MKNIVNNKKLVLFFAFLLMFFFCFSLSVSASVYEIYLYYNTADKTLSFDKKATSNIVFNSAIIPDYLSFAQNTAIGDYVLKLYDINDKEIISTEFNKTDGAFVLQLPYFSLANSLKIFEKKSNKEILQVNLSEYLTCNGNGICEFEKKENALNCMGDCATNNPTFSEETKKKLEENNGLIKDSATGETLLSAPSFIKTKPVSQTPLSSKNNFLPIFLLLILLVAVIILGILAYKKFKNQ